MLISVSTTAAQQPVQDPSSLSSPNLVRELEAGLFVLLTVRDEQGAEVNVARIESAGYKIQEDLGKLQSIA
jgi:hypothetical protein